MEISNYLKNRLAEHAVGHREWRMPAGTYLALFTTIPTSTGGTEVPASGGYERRSVIWTDADAGTLSNESALRFPSTGEATSNWGTIYGVGLYDLKEVGAGNLLFWHTLGTPRTVNTNDHANTAVGALTITLS